jgi:hypothetical protein
MDLRNGWRGRGMRAVRAAGLAALCAGMAVGLSGCIIIADGRSNGEYATSSTVSDTRTIEVAHVSGTPVDVRTANGAVKVEAKAVDKVRVVATVRAQTQERLDATQVKVERLADNTLSVSVAWPDDRRRASEGVSFDIAVPDAAGVKVKTSNGSISIAGLTGEAVLESSNGRVGVDGHAGAVKIDTSNGAVNVKDVSGPVWAESSNGGVELVRVGTPVKVDTNNGSVRVTLRDEATGPVKIDSSNGPVTLAVGPSFTGELGMDTSNGSVKVEDLAAASIVSMGKSSGRIRVGGVGSGGEESRIDTSNGAITVKGRASKGN